MLHQFPGQPSSLRAACGVLIGFAAFVFPAQVIAQKPPPTIIRLPDDRMDYFQVSAELQAVGNSICAMIPRTIMTANADGTFTLNAPLLSQERAPWCPGEPFGNQPAAADCSVTLVGPNIVATAGHCFENNAMVVQPLNTWYFVFDYIMRDATTIPTTFTADQVYTGAEILGRVNVANTANDWAVVRLDRVVTGRTPVGFRRDGMAAAGLQVVTIGFGAGLPMKFSGNSTIQSLIQFGFEADLDIIEGNSGGAVIDLNSRTIEGVISNDLAVSDFFMDGNCNRATRCPGDAICQVGFSQVCAVTVAEFQNALRAALATNPGGAMTSGNCGCGSGMMMMPMTLAGIGWMKRRRRR